MSIEKINKSVSIIVGNITQEAFEGNLKPTTLKYKENGDIYKPLEAVYTHSGIYMFTIEKNGKKAIAYAGKSERDQRLRNHITGKNKDGSKLKDSVGNKHSSIKLAIQNGYKVKVHLFSSPNFEKASLSCVEIKLLEFAKDSLETTFPDEPKWIKRIG